MNMIQGWTVAIRRIPQARLLDVVLIGAGLAFAGFYFLLFTHLNAAPVFQGPTVIGSLHQYQYAMDSCHTSSSNISISGWLAKPGLGWEKHATTALIRDESDGRMFVMKTDLPDREDVTKFLNKVLGDKVRYWNAGFAASLNLRASGRRIRKGRIYIAYDEDKSYTLVAMPCIFSYP